MAWAQRGSGAALHYVILESNWSGLFLIAAGLFYGVAGTSNMVHSVPRFVAQAQGV